MSRYETDLYFEAHVTIAMVNSVAEERLRKDVPNFGFRVADLYMQKGQKSLADIFMTGRGSDYIEIVERTERLVSWLKENKYPVLRFKIENTLLDIRFKEGVAYE